MSSNKKFFSKFLTPISFCETITQSIPRDFFSTSKKVLEPCAGNGNFIESIVRRFEENLVSDRKYILQNCIYIVDISEENIEEIQKRFNPDDNIQLNILHCDALSINISNYFDCVFDAVITNPPFNRPTESVNRNIMWQDFVKKSIQWTKENGYIALITPCLWRKPVFTGYEKISGIFDLLTNKNQMHYLSMNSIEDGKNIFNAGTPFDYYIVQKITPYKPTLIRDMKNNHTKKKLYEWNWFPNFNIETVEKLMNDEMRNNIFYFRCGYTYEPRKTHMSITKTELFKYPVLHGFNSNGPIFMYSSKNDVLGTKDLFNVPKILVGDFFGKTHRYIVDETGEYGMTNHVFAILYDDENEKQQICKAIESDELQNFIESIRWSQLRVDWRVFSLFKKDWYNEFNHHQIYIQDVAR
jgi:hypothetical protein